MSHNKLISISRRTLEESDRKLFYHDLGDLPIEEYKVITASRYISEYSLQIVSQYLTCVGKLLELYSHPYLAIRKYGKICLLYYYDEEYFYRRNGDFKSFNYQELLDTEKLLTQKTILKLENDTIDPEESALILEALQLPTPQIIDLELDKHLDNVVNGILTSNGKGGFYYYNPK